MLDWLANMKKIIYPLLVLIGGAFGLFALNTYVYFDYKNTIMLILNALFLFVLGISLNERKLSRKNNKACKIISIIFMILFILLQLNAIKVDVIIAFVSMLGLTKEIYCAIYVFLGYLYMG